MISGIGKKATLNSLINLSIDGNTKFYKFGTCAILDNTFPLLTPLIPSYSGYEDRMLKVTIPDTEQTANNIRIYKGGLYTSDKPVTDKSASQKIYEKGFGLVDMETFHFREKIPQLIPVIVGTDHADKKAIPDFYLNVKKASIILSDAFKNLILDKF